jgi:hypothetical protein
MYISMVNNWVKEETERLSKSKLESEETMKKILKSKKK